MFYSVPDVHAADRVIPAGKTLLAESGIPAGDPRAIPTTLDKGTSRQTGTEVLLEAIPAGWAHAGSVARWDNGCFRVSTTFQGSRHGRRYRTYEEAVSLFDKWTA